MNDTPVTTRSPSAVGDMPLDAPSAFTAALAQHQAGDVEGAMRLYRRAIELDPGASDAYNNLANLLAGQDKVPAAVACLRRAVTVAPNGVTILANLGTYLRQLGRLEEASRA